MLLRESREELALDSYEYRHAKQSRNGLSMAECQCHLVTKAATTTSQRQQRHRKVITDN